MRKTAKSLQSIGAAFGEISKALARDKQNVSRVLDSSSIAEVRLKRLYAGPELDETALQVLIACMTFGACVGSRSLSSSLFDQAL